MAFYIAIAEINVISLLKSVFTVIASFFSDRTSRALSIDFYHFSKANNAPPQI
jgi:hypothetical protein